MREDDGSRPEEDELATLRETTAGLGFAAHAEPQDWGVRLDSAADVAERAARWPRPSRWPVVGRLLRRGR